MRIISYNTYKCSQAKIDHILAMDADLYVLPECFSKDHIVLPEGYDMLWCGDEDLTEKGLGVIWKKRLDVHVIPEYKKIKHILPIIVNGAGFPSKKAFLHLSCVWLLSEYPPCSICRRIS